MSALSLVLLLLGASVLAVVIFLVYGGILWGVFPTQVGVSWQAHLGGAAGGVLAAWTMHRRRTATARG